MKVGRAAALVAAIAGACTPAGGSTVAGVTLPILRDAIPLAEQRIDGVLLLDDGCLWLATQQGQPLLVLWPRGTTLHPEEDQAVLTVDGHAAPMGAEVTLAGQPRSADGAIDDLLVDPVTPVCPSDAYWLASTLVAVDGEPVSPPSS